MARMLLRAVPALPAVLTVPAAPAAAQGGNCVTGNLLQVNAAFSRPGAGGTFDYSVQVTNLTLRPVVFRVRFRMTGAQLHPAILRQAFTLPARGSGLIILGNGTELSTTNRIAGGVLLTC